MTKKVSEGRLFLPSDRLRSSRNPNPNGSDALMPLIILLVAFFLPIGLTYSLATINENFVIGSILLIVFLMIIIKNPFFGLHSFIFLIYIRPEDFLGVKTGIHYALIIGMFTFFTVIIRNFINHSPNNKSPVIYMFLGFGISAIISGLIAGLFGPTTEMVMRLVAIIFLIADLVNSPKRYNSIVVNIFLCTFYLAIYSIYLFYSGSALLQEGVLRARGSGIFNDPNDLAATIVPGLALSLSRIISKNRFNLVYIVLSGILLFAIALTNSRGGMLGVACVIVSIFLMRNKHKTIGIIVASVLVFVVFILAPARMSNIDTSETSANGRLTFWITGVENFIQKPILGIGPNKFPDINDGYTAHNSFVLCFTEVGFIGYFFWIGCIYLAYKSQIASLKIKKSDAVGMVAALNGIFVCCFFISRTYNMPLVVMLGIASSPLSLLDGSVVIGFNKKDVIRIVLLCVTSIIFIYVFARVLVHK